MNKIKKRQRQDSNLRTQRVIDFKSTALDHSATLSYISFLLYSFLSVYYISISIYIFIYIYTYTYISFYYYYYYYIITIIIIKCIEHNLTIIIINIMIVSSFFLFK